MSLIGYIADCQRCEVRMLVTAEARTMRHCPDCLRELILDAVEDTDHIPPWQVHG